MTAEDLKRLSPEQLAQVAKIESHPGWHTVLYQPYEGQPQTVIVVARSGGTEVSCDTPGWEQKLDDHLSGRKESGKP